MAEGAIGGETPGIFISYRREDAPGHAGRLHDALRARFGEEQVFMDLDMEPGVDFVEQINQAVGSCRLLIVVIGPRWAGAQDAHGRRRLEDPADFIRIEVEAGLRQTDVRVVPVLVHGATMPSAKELPPTLADLARRNALELSDARWTYDVDRLASAADRVLGLGGQRSTAPEHSERDDRRGKRDRAAQPPTHTPADVPVDDRARPAMRSRIRRHRRLLTGVPLVAAVVGVVAAVVASGGDDGGPSESPLFEVIPASVQERCHRLQGQRVWMRSDGAVEQYECDPLPRSVLSKAVPGGSVTYGVFRNASQAQKFVENDFRDAVNQKSKTCDPEAREQLDADYPEGDAECYENAEGITINWSYPDSAIGVQLYFYSGTSIDAAVDARAKLL